MSDQLLVDTVVKDAATAAGAATATQVWLQRSRPEIAGYGG